ncbi:MAG: endonuclease V [Conexivisphaerales archaeon]
MATKFGDILPFAKRLQFRLSELFEDEGIEADRIRYTLAIDAAYQQDRAVCVAVKYDTVTKKVTKKWTLQSSVFFPYVPSYFYLREAPPVIRLLDRIDEDYDLILIDAHGRLHPRRAGSATIIGVLASKPTIGIAKSRLIGRAEKMKEGVSEVTVKGEVLGYRIGKGGKAFFVSQGNMISKQEMLKFMKMREFEYPEELKVADSETKKFRMTP